MSSTNKTTHYELSQFLGTDKPAWLNDYNSDMNKIDAGINTAQTTASGADGKATTNASSIGTLANLTTTAKTDLVSAVNEVNTTASSASSVASGAGTTATQAKNKADALEAYLTLNTTASATFTATTGTVPVDYNSVDIRTNASKSLGKIYGTIRIQNIPANTTNITITSGDTGLRPSAAITFNGCSIIRHLGSGSYRDFPQSYTLNTDGTITSVINATGSSQIDLFFLAVLLFITDFGDVPQPE